MIQSINQLQTDPDMKKEIRLLFKHLIQFLFVPSEQY